MSSTVRSRRIHPTLTSSNATHAFTCMACGQFLRSFGTVRPGPEGLNRQQEGKALHRLLCDLIRELRIKMRPFLIWLSELRGRGSQLTLTLVRVENPKAPRTAQGKSGLCFKKTCKLHERICFDPPAQILGPVRTKKADL